MKHFITLFKILFLGSLLAMAFKVPDAAPLFAFGVFAFLLSVKRVNQPGVYAADVSPDVSAIQTYLGKVKQGLHAKLMNSLDIANDITLVPNVKNVLTLTELVIKNGPKPYTGVFNPVGNDISYQPRSLTVEPFQRDLIVDPRKYRTSYFSEQRGPGEGSKSNKIPFEAFTIKTVLENDAAIMNDQTAFNGLGKAAFAAFNPATNYTTGARVFFAKNNEIQYFIATAATTAGQTPITHSEKWQESNALAICQGLGTKIRIARDADEITNIISVSGLDPYAKFKKIWRSQSPKRKAIGGKIFAPHHQLEALIDDFEDKVGKYTETDGSGRMFLSGTKKKAELVPATWMTDTDMIFTGPKDNFLMGTDLLSDMNEVNIIPDVYTLKMGVAGVLGFNFQDPREIAISDED